MRVGTGTAFALLSCATVSLAQETVTPPKPAPLTLPRTTAAITIDGDLSDAGWSDAATIDTFWETAFGDNRAPIVKTIARVVYDDKYLYIAVECDDPNPDRIRAPYVDRDAVIGTDDNVAILLDTRGDRRSAQEFRVNPRGIQGDAIFNDANGNEDFSPDFYYDTAAKITDRGWQAEIRIPLTSLRYPKAEPQKWGIIVWRNYPRDFRYAIYSSPQPRGANCFICLSRELVGINGLPSSSHLVAAPYVSAQNVAEAPNPGDPLAESKTDKNVGLDVKWSPGANTALDGTINPDFSQVESDVAQISVNNRFALFYPEKRPFFLEGVDLFDTLIQAVYTRTISSPRWGGRATGKFGSTTYTALFTQDRGGGSVILPGPTSSDLAPQDFRSVVGIARVRHDLGASFIGLIYAGRQIEDSGHNHVIGPDFLWRPSQFESITGQALLSDTQTPNRPDLTPQWNGNSFTSHAFALQWNHQKPNHDWTLRYNDFGDGFRADVGFVPQVGYREGSANVGYRLYPSGLLNFFRPFVFGDVQYDRGGRMITQQVQPGIFALGRHNLNLQANLNFSQIRASGVLLPITSLTSNVQIDPSRRITRVGVNSQIGEDVDYANVRVGHGATITAFATLRPSDHLTLDVNAAWQWLDVETAPGTRSRLFSAEVQRLKATYNASARLFVRLIGQYVNSDRDPTLYTSAVPARSSQLTFSGLFSYKINWQTALFLGYGDERDLTPLDELAKTRRDLFVKLSYAFQR
jgi:hypothetical protein